MKSVNEIISDIDKRILPQDLQTIGVYVSELQKVTSNASSRVSMLLAVSRRQVFKENAKGFLDWAQSSFRFDRKYASHSLRIGEMLLDVKEDTFNKIGSLPTDKLLALSRLQVDELAVYAGNKDLTTLSRDELRSDVSRLLGESAKEKAAKPAPVGYTLRDMVHEAATMTPQAMAIMAETSTAEQVCEMIAAGQSLLMMGVKALIDRKLGSLEGLNSLEGYLEAQLQAVKDGAILAKEASTAPANVLPAALAEVAP